MSLRATPVERLRDLEAMIDSTPRSKHETRGSAGSRMLCRIINETDPALMAASFTASGDDFARGSVQALFAIPADMPTTDLGRGYDVATDGRFLMARQYVGGGENTSIELVRNFQEMLRGLGGG